MNPDLRPPRPPPEALLPWALASLALPQKMPPTRFSMIAGDASNRRYFRLIAGVNSYIVVEAPPTTEKNEAFLTVRQLLADAGVRVPGLLAADLQRGFLLLEDLGDRVLLPELSADTVEGEYHRASQVLCALATIGVDDLDWPRYDRTLFTEELGRFPTWFAGELLDCPLSAPETGLFARFAGSLMASALAQPQVLVHRDFHSRNLMPQADGRLGVIDFQDAVIGPVTYDPASLLRDCYISWPAERVRGWALDHRRRLLAEGLLARDVCDEQLFLRWFDWMGLQRHIKVLGTFARLSLRDNKPGYLDDLPLVLRYVREILDLYASEEPVFREFRAWLEQRLLPRVALQTWGADL